MNKSETLSFNQSAIMCDCNPLHTQLGRLKATLRFMVGTCVQAHAANTHHANSMEFEAMDSAITKLERLVDDATEAVQRAQEVN